MRVVGKRGMACLDKGSRGPPAPDPGKGSLSARPASCDGAWGARRGDQLIFSAASTLSTLSLPTASTPVSIVGGTGTPPSTAVSPDVLRPLWLKSCSVLM